MLGGRRLAVADLVASGLLKAGTALLFRRPRSGAEYRAEVTPTGSLRLEDGREFTSPSRAAGNAASGSFDGWNAWVLESTGETLDQLRQALLDEVVSRLQNQEGQSETVVATMQARHPWLREARSSADQGNPVQLTVRELIAHWHATARGAVISQRIEDELADHGLVTSPSFRAVTLDTAVSLIHAPIEQAEEATESFTPSDEGTGVDVGLTLGNIPSALGGVTDIGIDATFDEAITIMRLNDFSQLAVLNGPFKLHGAVTWRSIADVRHRRPSATLRDAIVEAREARFDEELIDVLDGLYTHDFVFVRNDRNAFAGIVTTADVVAAYGALATPFFLVGEIDRRLRWLLGQGFPLAEIVAICDPPGERIKSTDDLSFGDYEWLLQNPENWIRLGWPFDRAVFVQRLREIREQRNDLTHFNPDPLPADAVPNMRHFLRLLRELSE
jgi:CBS domain-containing protein